MCSQTSCLTNFRDHPTEEQGMDDKQLQEIERKAANGYRDAGHPKFAAVESDIRALIAEVRRLRALAWNNLPNSPS